MRKGAPAESSVRRHGGGMELLERLAEKSGLHGRLLCGVSGGADSVALLRMLLVVRDSGKAEVSTVHVNHGLRGADADEDEAFVRTLCHEHHVPLTCLRCTPPANPGEGWAREARYGCFRQAMQDTGADALVLAHHRRDQAETLLLHLMRGAGLTGLCGMTKESCMDGMRILRPLLDIPPEALRDALTALGQPWREDATNRETRYLRNAVRHELLPMMERLAPGASERIAHTARLLAEDEQVLGTEAKQFLCRYSGATWLRLKALEELPTGMQNRVLRLWWLRFAGDVFDERGLSRTQTEALSALVTAKAGARCNLPGGFHGERGWQCLHLIGKKRQAVEEKPVQPMQTTLLGVTLTVMPSGDTAGDGKRCQAVPAGFLEGCILRTRRTGDWLRPFGTGRKSLQDYFTDRRVDAAFRDDVPLLCRGDEVLLVAGVGAGAVPRWSPGDAWTLLRWTGDMPWMAEG